jgi:hypothetical protein
MHFISLGSSNFSALLFFKDNIKKLKKQVKRIRILINERQLTDDLTALFFRYSRKEGETFQAYRSSHSFWGLSDAAIFD